MVRGPKHHSQTELDLNPSLPPVCSWENEIIALSAVSSSVRREHICGRSLLFLSGIFFAFFLGEHLFPVGTLLPCG